VSQSTYDAVTARITEALDRGAVPWRKPWNDSFAIPCNAVSHRPYSGINLLLLSINPFTDHRWVTFTQARALGGHVKFGELSSLAIFWKQWQPEGGEDGKEVVPGRSIPVLRHYHLFNVEQCEELKIEPLQVPATNPAARMEEAEAVVRAMPDPPHILEQGRSAWYRPHDDQVGMPPLDRFASADHFYATLFHELAHATGHEKRLARKGIMETIVFGSDSYGHEELVAELASAYCCASIGLDNSLVGDSASYIDHWLSVLKHDHKAIVVAAGQAKRAADYIRGLAGNAPDPA
jgi:antirestriction protein ArdC